MCFLLTGVGQPELMPVIMMVAHDAAGTLLLQVKALQRLSLVHRRAASPSLEAPARHCQLTQ
eukprot:861733-Rhodomonas_salina.2